MRNAIIALFCTITLRAAPLQLTLGPPVMVAPEGAREGPSWNPFTQTLYMVSGGNVNRYQPGGKVEPFRTDAPGANGSLIDPEGRVLVCEAGGRRVTRTEKDGTLTVLAAEFEGKKFNSPNDLTLDAKGRIYFTDPRYGSRDSMELREEAVYRIDAPGKVARVLGQPELERPNGILISPDGRH
ncbi:MAG TPA: SMP-30/gluconolactonase/LRE family protein, partial [Bryobacteraceae bacterium]|nr:SMP-30/gluconolactonase/LRE family protein [Bryobacteraceae bacterium]